MGERPKGNGRCFVEMCRRTGLRVNAVKSKVMVLNGEAGLECEVSEDGVQLEHVSEFKYLGCVSNESGTDEEKCQRKVCLEEGLAGVIRPLVNARGLQLECARYCMKHCSYLLLYMAVRK